MVTICASFCVHTARIIGLVFWDWEFEKPKDDYKRFVLEVMCKVVPIDQHVGPLHGVFIFIVFSKAVLGFQKFKYDL